MESLERFVKVAELGLYVAPRRLRDKDGNEIAGVPNHLNRILAERDLEMHNLRMLTPEEHLRMLTPEELRKLIALQKEYPEIHKSIMRGYPGDTSGEITKDAAGKYWEFMEGEQLESEVSPDRKQVVMGLGVWEAVTYYAGVREAYPV